MKLLLKDVGERFQCVVEVVVAEHGDAKPEKNQPTI
jgi:hypothetical protein